MGRILFTSPSNKGETINMIGALIFLSFILANTSGSPIVELMSLHPDVDMSAVNPCKDEELLSCTSAFVDLKKLEENQIFLPEGIVLQKKKTFKEGKTSFALFSDGKGNEGFFSYRDTHMMGKVSKVDSTMYFIEPCKNWEGCHVWKKISQNAFVDETHENDVDAKKLSKVEVKRIEELKYKGENDKDEIAEFTIMFYYTTDFAAHTDDIELFMDTIIGDMNLGYENSNIPVRAKLHCVEAADLHDLDESRDMLHAFNDYKPSYSEIRESADSAQLIANNFHNCGSGYTYTATGSSGHTLTVVKKSCAFGYHSSLHEVGHNFGCQHDEENGHNTHYEYGYGYFIGPEDLDNTGYRTAMAYRKDGHATRVNYLSNPDVEYKGFPTGDARKADNARVITENRFLMADIGDESQSCHAD